MSSKTNKAYYLYLLCCADNTLYTGITTDVERRVKEHNGEKLGAKYTRTRQPVRLEYSQLYENRSEASKAEAQIKKLTRKEKIALINQAA